MAGFNSKLLCQFTLNAPFVVFKTHCLDEFNTHRFSKASHSVTRGSI